MDNICLMMKIEHFLGNKDFDFEIKTKFGIAKCKLAKDRTYSIPAYQREIRWKAENVNILIDDLIASDKFLGTVLLNKVDDLNYEIIDGQQRISVLILILKAIGKKNSKSFSLCNFQNKTYEHLFDVLNLDFNEYKINADADCKKYITSDILEQRERFEIIWKTINKRLDLMSPQDLVKMSDNLLSCEINIILADKPNSKLYVDYYLDLNDKSVKLDNIDILKANLFKIDYVLMSAEWANVQKAIKELRTVGLSNYSLPTFYYHYFACSVNEYIDYKLSTLKSDLKFEKSVDIGGYSYEAGTNILKAIKDQQYFGNAIGQLKGVTAFLKNVYLNDGLIDIKQKLKTNHCDDDTISCIFSIISAIIRIDDEVPKMLIMKYFLDVLDKDIINKNDVKIIFYIYVYSILFALTRGKKESSKLVRIVLSKDWIEKLQAATIKLWDERNGEIDYWKRITVNGKISDISGQYIPKHIMAIKEYATITPTSITFDQRKLKEFLGSSTCTAEHFFINKSHKVTFKYGVKAIESEMYLPKSITKYISCPINYLYINSDANCDLENLTIKEKIDLLDKKGEAVFSSKMSFNYFEKAKDAFDAFKSNYPDLSSFTNKAKAKSALLKYYKDNLVDMMLVYENLIKTL